MTNVYSKKLTKEVIFNLSQLATPIGDVLETPLKVVGLHHKSVTTGDGELKTLTIIFVDEEGEIKPYFSSASSFFNGMEDVAGIFGGEIEKGGLTIQVRTVETRNKNTVYAISL